MGRIGWGDFVIWQCSLRQRNFRMFGGKPSEGTIASFSNLKSDIQLGNIRSILMENNGNTNINSNQIQNNEPTQSFR